MYYLRLGRTYIQHVLLVSLLTLRLLSSRRRETFRPKYTRDLIVHRTPNIYSDVCPSIPKFYRESKSAKFGVDFRH